MTDLINKAPVGTAIKADVPFLPDLSKEPAVFTIVGRGGKKTHVAATYEGIPIGQFIAKESKEGLKWSRYDKGEKP
mgnify:CR=1 FL=1